MTEFSGTDAPDADEPSHDSTAWWSWRDATPLPAEHATPTPSTDPVTDASPTSAANPGWGTAPSVVWPTAAPPTSALPPPPPPTASTAITSDGGRPRRRPWLGIAAIAIVAALIGGLVGGWLTKRETPTSSITIQQSPVRPGAALVSNTTSIPALVKLVSPAVVSIDVTSPAGQDQGTGMIITHSGYVVTNNHVIAAAAQGGGSITVTRTGTSAVLQATLLGTNTTDDIALLKIQHASNLPTVTFGSSRALEVGDGVVAIGNALGLAAGTPTVTQGIVSALGRTVTAGDASTSSTETLHNMIQTDAAINPGNSGGPLVDSNGHVIGMNTAVAGTAPDGSNSQNIGFAIPSATIEQLIPTLNHPVSSTPAHGGGYLGVLIRTVTPALVASNGLSVHSGAFVDQAVTGYPAAQAGIKTGDVIVSINNTTVASDAQVASVLSGIKPGTTVQVAIVRGTQHLTVQVTVTSHPAA
jgi:S1-C subfamily serine protease